MSGDMEAVEVQGAVHVQAEEQEHAEVDRMRCLILTRRIDAVDGECEGR